MPFDVYSPDPRGCAPWIQYCISHIALTDMLYLQHTPHSKTTRHMYPVKPRSGSHWLFPSVITTNSSWGSCRDRERNLQETTRRKGQVRHKLAWHLPL